MLSQGCVPLRLDEHLDESALFHQADETAVLIGVAAPLGGCLIDGTLSGAHQRLPSLVLLFRLGLRKLCYILDLLYHHRIVVGSILHPHQ